MNTTPTHAVSSTRTTRQATRAGLRKALAGAPQISLDSEPALDAPERLKQLETDNRRLRELVQHCSAYWAYSHCGYQHMDAAQRSLYDEVIGRSARAQKALSDSAAASAAWRHCEFCGCKSNAAERVCCRQGRDLDRKAWNRKS